jgi:DMSO/TMAO reductase YedYZ molybdopterin-dependent catalytic subunit
MSDHLTLSPTLAKTQRIPAGQYETKQFPVLSITAPPRFDPRTYTLRIFGQVEQPLELSWEQVLALPRVKVKADFHCVTRWSRLDNLWEGPSALTLHGLVKPKPGAVAVMMHGLEGYTTNLLLKDWLQPDCLMALTHEGKALPPEHGAPARGVVPQLYAWKGAKFMCGIEYLSEDAPGFWELRGYHMHGDPYLEERYGD